VGFLKPVPFWIVVAGAVALYLLNMALGGFVSPVLAEWISPTPVPSFMAYVRGNVSGFLLWLAIGLGVGGFMEELLFRGFLLNRVAEMLGGSSSALGVGIVAQAVLFGLLHLYAAPSCACSRASRRWRAGIVYLLVKRNLWPLIVAHAVWNSVGIWGVYAS